MVVESNFGCGRLSRPVNSESCVCALVMVWDDSEDGLAGDKVVYTYAIYIHQFPVYYDGYAFCRWIFRVLGVKNSEAFLHVAFLNLLHLCIGQVCLRDNSHTNFLLKN